MTTHRASERATRPWTPLHLLAPLGLAGLMLGGAGCGGPASARTMPPPAESPESPASNDEKRASSTPIRLAPAQPFFVAGETMAFELSYGGILTGRAVLAVGEPGEIDGRQLLIVRSQFETAGAAKLITVVRDSIDTRLDWNTGVPVEHRGEAMGKARATAFIRFDGERTAIEYQREGKRKLELHVTLPPGEIMHDMHTMLGALRAWEPEPGAQVYFYSTSGRRVWRTDLTYRGSETMRTAMGLRAAMRFSGSSARLHHRSLNVDASRPPRSVDLWISDDVHRMPLRVLAHTEFGDFQAELVSYHSPGEQVSLN